MNKDQLGYFLLVYQTRNVAEAAASIPMSPQGLNKSIRSLEQELGVQLFTADSNGNRVPTRYADAFAGYVERVDAEFNNVVKEFETIRAKENATVRLTSALGFSGFAGQACADAFCAQHPNINVVMEEKLDRQCDAAVADGEADLAFVLAPFDPTLATTTIHRERAYLWVHESSPLAERSSLQAADLDGQAIASFGEGLKIHARLLSLLEEAGAEPSVIVCSPEVFWHYQAALENKALGLTVEHLVDRDVFTQSNSVRAIPLEGLDWTAGISHRLGRPLTPHQQAFWEFAIRYFA